MTTRSPMSPDIDPLGPSADGSITFVSGGPAFANLVSVCALRAIRAADIIVVDDESQVDLVIGFELHKIPTFLVAPESVDEFLAQAREGKDVVRFIEGDFFLDGDVTELEAVLPEQRIRVDVVPGVSLIAAAASYLGVTANAWSFFNAIHSVPSEWPMVGPLLIRTNESVLPSLIAACPRDTDETVLVTTGLGSTSQHTTIATWSTIGEIEHDGPIFLLAGYKAGARDTLNWFSSKPLFDWRVLIPVAKDQGGVVSSRLRAFGALPEEVPTMSIEPPRTEQQMEKATRGLIDGRYKWIVFTSPNAVEAIRARFIEYGLDSRALSGIEIAAVGQGTSRALHAWGIAPDLMPAGQQTTTNLAASFPAFDDLLDPINRVLVPRAEISTDLLLAGLEGLGWEVEDVTAYRTVRAAPPPAETREAIKTGLFDAVVFASSSTVRNLIGIAGKPHSNVVVVAIGDATAATCAEHGLRVDAISPDQTTRSLADTLAKFAFDRRQAQLLAGETPAKPSQRRRRRRKRFTEVDVDQELLD